MLPKNYPMTMEQMLASNEERKPKKLSRRELLEANKATVQNIVDGLLCQLRQNEEDARNGVKISLRDTQRVKDISLQYIESCKISGTLPTVTGVALALGITTDAIVKFRSRNPDHETTKWFMSLTENFGQIMMQAALDGAVAPVPAIFTAKARYGWRDDPEPEVKDNSDTEELSPDAIAAKYSDLPD